MFFRWGGNSKLLLVQKYNDEDKTDFNVPGKFLVKWIDVLKSMYHGIPLYSMYK